MSKFRYVNAENIVLVTRQKICCDKFLLISKSHIPPSDSLLYSNSSGFGIASSFPCRNTSYSVTSPTMSFWENDIIHCLIHNGVSKRVLGILSSFLYGKIASVHVKTVNTPSSDIKASIPQATLSSILYNMFVEDMRRSQRGKKAPSLWMMPHNYSTSGTSRWSRSMLKTRKSRFIQAKLTLTSLQRFRGLTSKRKIQLFTSFVRARLIYPCVQSSQKFPAVSHKIQIVPQNFTHSYFEKIMYFYPLSIIEFIFNIK